MLIEEVVAPHRDFGIAIDVALPRSTMASRWCERSPAILYGLGNLVENAVDFAAGGGDRGALERAGRGGHDHGRRTRAFRRRSCADRRALRDEPAPHRREGEESGLGLGFFIAKTLLERSGATVAFLNRQAPERVPW